MRPRQFSVELLDGDDVVLRGVVLLDAPGLAHLLVLVRGGEAVLAEGTFILVLLRLGLPRRNHQGRSHILREGTVHVSEVFNSICTTELPHNFSSSEMFPQLAFGLEALLETLLEFRGMLLPPSPSQTV